MQESRHVCSGDQWNHHEQGKDYVHSVYSYRKTSSSILCSLFCIHKQIVYLFVCLFVLDISEPPTSLNEGLWVANTIICDFGGIQ